ncbi:peptidoglycan DD-metalloendopeptidase family protein [Streptomyces sp. MRC013]|uniref:peptidoglycan DD-metalloendopeptidase family protein n=1 Tax=Streptomyces sp. MRC013 TaxID=2898276 RepID=UPI0020260C7B|nr:peptidoglycan DD-metalloendopeptidase family protein [Streptomyces sp. MRC013]URM89972.1 peptidoglycan DD-metalloendopeptidase family protein [Streptomyces sp. MRC013]
MNDQHPHAGYVGDDVYTTGSFTTSESGFGDGGQVPAYGLGSYGTGAHQVADPLYGDVPGGYDTGYDGRYDTTGWPDAYTTYADRTGQWDTAAWPRPQDDQQYAATAPTYGTTGQWYAPEPGPYGAELPGAEGYGTDPYATAAWTHVPEGAAPVGAFIPEQYDPSAVDGAPGAEPEADPAHGAEDEPRTGDFAFETDGFTDDFAEGFVDGFADELTDGGPSTESLEVLDEAVAPAPAARPARRAGGSRGRRRTPARRSALLTVAVPSACVMGVAGIAAASVSGLTGTEQDDGTAVTAADPASLKPAVVNSALDTQLAALDAEALDFSDRASRTQERIDLKARQEAERKKREEEAKRREAMRPKFALPVHLRQLSAGYGQAGVNWMSLHTGIDFPVQYGTPVMAATDGTVRTQWNSAYGNMVIVTAKDGTETWYCHLSSAKIRSGFVKAGDVIAYSGNSGNSTGPHLHFEVRPGGGTAIDPEAWLREHGLNPTG